jgi:hypothetical protein
MSKTIKVTVEFTVKEFKDMLEEADYKIDDPAKFKEYIRSEEFAQALATDLKDTWAECNQDADMVDIVEDLFGGAGCSSQLEMWVD